MSFATTITLKDASAANAVFNRMRSDMNKVDYTLGASTLQEPIMFRVAQTLSDSPTGTNRHLAKFHRVKMDATTKKTVPLVLNVTMSRPKEFVTDSDCNDLIAYAREFFNDPVRVAAFLKGDV